MNSFAFSLESFTLPSSFRLLSSMDVFSNVVQCCDFLFKSNLNLSLQAKRGIKRHKAPEHTNVKQLLFVFQTDPHDEPCNGPTFQALLSFTGRQGQSDVCL